ncbi:hypothetical protein BJ165DRAFT_349138 [Panaeolus papilionaceus]|nr:hypothetical protein BJ165DRAFT_349138 [Panaeolus papilionaceus]
MWAGIVWRLHVYLPRLIHILYHVFVFILCHTTLTTDVVHDRYYYLFIWLITCHVPLLLLSSCGTAFSRKGEIRTPHI